jgi:predicted RecA/RadA family phage recombinase
MAKKATKIQTGDVVDYTAAATIANGDVIALTGRVGVALDDAVSGDVISLALTGVYEVTAATADAVTFGALVYWDESESNLTTTSTDNTLAGFAVSTKAGATAGSIYVKIG